MTLRILYSLENLSVLQWQDTDLFNYADPAVGMSLVDVTLEEWNSKTDPMWYVDGNLTTIEPTFEVPPPTPAEILASQSAKLQLLKQLAEAQKVALSARIGVLNDAIELEMSTPEEEAELPTRVLQLKAWKTYAVLLGRVTGQSGWPPEVDWPVQPTGGMDLTISASAPEAA